MSIWDSLLRLFGQKPTPVTKKTSTVKPDITANVVLATEVEPDDSLPTPAPVPVDLFTLLFSKKDKHKTTMLNSITLSTDMKTLYLIDNGRAIPYDLTVPEGIMVGLLGDQLVVATGVKAPEIGDAPTDDTSGGKPETDKIVVKAGKNSQFTLAYNENNSILSIYGVEDIILHLTNPDDENTKEAFFEIGRNKVVRIRRLEDDLIVEKI